MKTKTCPSCGPQPVSHFGWKNKAKSIRQSLCKSCQNAYTKKWYGNNKDSHKAAVVIRNQKVTEENQRKVFEYLLSHPCIDCEESNPIVLDFDHDNPSKKKANISVLVRGYSWKVVLNEISKCTVRCGNCHRKRTSKEGNHIRWKLWCSQQDSNLRSPD